MWSSNFVVTYHPSSRVAMATASVDQTNQTFQFKDEDHTLGNALRWLLAKNPEVEFVGYTMPHPSEPLMNLRIQTYKRPAEQLLDEALAQLVEICDVMDVKFAKAIKKFQWQ